MLATPIVASAQPVTELYVAARRRCELDAAGEHKARRYSGHRVWPNPALFGNAGGNLRSAPGSLALDVRYAAVYAKARCALVLRTGSGGPVVHMSYLLLRQVGQR